MESGKVKQLYYLTGVAVRLGSLLIYLFLGIVSAWFVAGLLKFGYLIFSGAAVGAVLALVWDTSVVLSVCLVCCVGVSLLISLSLRSHSECGMRLGKEYEESAKRLNLKYSRYHLWVDVLLDSIKFNK